MRIVNQQVPTSMVIMSWKSFQKLIFKNVDKDKFIKWLNKECDLEKKEIEEFKHMSLSNILHNLFIELEEQILFNE